MDVKDQITPPTPSGVHLCHKCGWAFPNPHPSAKHRRAHKKICGTIDGYTNLTGPEVGSEDDKEKTPSDISSPKIGEKIRGSFSRSEDELFSDAVTEFSDSGNKSLDKDLFFSFKDDESDEISNVDTSVKVSEKIDTDVEKFGETEVTTLCNSSESNLELTDKGLVKYGVVGPAPEPSYFSHTEETKSVDLVEAGEEKGQESHTSEPITKEAKDSGLTRRSIEVSAIVGGDHDNVKQGSLEKLELSIADGISDGIKQEIKSDCEHVSEVVNQYESVKETNIEKLELKNETAPEVVKESETDYLEGVAEELEHENFESDHKNVPEVAKESATVKSISVLITKDEFGAPNVAILTEEKDIETQKLEESSIEPIQEVLKEPNTVLTEKEDLDGPHTEKELSKQNHEVIEEPVSVLTKKQDLGKPELEKSLKEQIQEVMKKPATVLTEKEDLGGLRLEEQSNEHNHEVVEKTDSVLTESQDLGAPELEKSSKENVEEPNLFLTEIEDLVVPKSEKCSKDEVAEQIVDIDSSVVADVSVEMITRSFSSDNSLVNGKNVSDVHETIIEEGKMINQDSGAALSVGSSTRSSLEGNWGSVSVLSTASIDGGTLQSTEKSKVNSGKSNAATSDVFEPPSLMTLVELESKDKKPDPSEVQDSEKHPNSEVSQAGRKRKEEVFAKVTNWSTAKQSTRLKNLLGEAKSSSGAQPDPMVQKDEAIVNPSVNDDVSSPPKMIDDDKKGRKKVRGLSSWVPFVCCSSVNVVN